MTITSSFAQRTDTDVHTHTYTHTHRYISKFIDKLLKSFLCVYTLKFLVHILLFQWQRLVFFWSLRFECVKVELPWRGFKKKRMKMREETR